MRAISIDGTSGTILAINADGAPASLGSMYNDVCDAANLAKIAAAINALPEIEFADIERIPVLHQGCGPDAPGPCNIPSPNCADPAGFDAIFKMAQAKVGKSGKAA